MLKLRINPIVAKDLKNIRDYIAEGERNINFMVNMNNNNG